MEKAEELLWVCICSDCMDPFSPTWHQSWLHGMPQYQQWRPEELNFMRWFHDCIILHVPTRKWQAKVLINYWHFLERIQTFNLQNWPLQLLIKLLWKWQFPLWTILPLAWDAFPSFQWGTWFCCLSNYVKAPWDRISRAILKWCEDHQKWQEGKYSGESLEKWAILYTSAKLEEAQLLRNTDLSKDSNNNVFGDDDLR